MPALEGLRPRAAVTLFDTHVHVYPCADVVALLSSAWRHFDAAATLLGAQDWAGLLFLTETAGDRWFDAVARSPAGVYFGEWHVAPVESDPLSLHARCGAGSLTIVAGRQIVTRERLEVHALGTRAEIADGAGIDATIQRVQDSGALPVLPWGVGKWTGRRRAIVSNLLAAAGEEVLVSDNSGRPRFWQDSLLVQQHRAGRVVLRGSDALPLNAEELRTGSFGCWFAGAEGGESTARSVLSRLRGASAEEVHPYGRSETAWRFVRNQVALRLRRRRSGRPAAPEVVN